jgi:hypothetical protein
MATEMDLKSMREEIERLRKENAEMKKNSGLVMKVTDYKQVAVVFNKYECRLYKNQWMRIIENREELIRFIRENEDELA